MWVSGYNSSPICIASSSAGPYPHMLCKSPIQAVASDDAARRPLPTVRTTKDLVYQEFMRLGMDLPKVLRITEANTKYR